MAPDGPMVADVPINSAWVWVLVAVGISIVAAGGLLL
jgi:hypothetical protein